MKKLSHINKRESLFAFVSAAAAAVLVFYPIQNYDFFWHIANGRNMVQNLTIVNTEIFSFTKAGAHFHNHEWLSQILFYLMYEHLGSLGLVIFKSTVVALTGYLLFRTMRYLDVRPEISGVLVMVAIVLGIGRYTIRPQIFSFLFISLQGFLLYGYRKGNVGYRWLFILAPVMVLWDYLHGAV